MQVPLWGPLGGSLCRWPCYHCWIAWGICQEALDLEGSKEKKGLRVNAGNTKIMIWDTGLELLQSSGKFPCAVCRTGVGSNSIFCNGCKHWVHKKCSGLKRLTKDPDYRRTRCQGTACPLDGRSQKEVQIGPDKLEVVASFCYLGDMLSAAGGCELSTITRVKNAWKKFKDLLPVLPSRHLSFKHVAVCTALLCGAQCSMPARLGHWQSQTSSFWSEMTGQWSDRSAMSGCKTLSPPGPMSYLHGLALRIWTLFWRREGSDGMDMWNAPMVQSTAFDIQVDEKRGPGRPKMTSKQLTERDCREWKLSAINPHDRHTLEIWCEICHVCSKPAIWKGAHWCRCCPCTCTLIKNLIMIMMMIQGYDSCILQFPSWPSISVSSFIKLLSIFLEIFSRQNWDGRTDWQTDRWMEGQMDI